MNYFAYCRKSSEGERQQHQSIETQIRIIKEKAERDGLYISKWFIESKSAADDGQRAQFDEMIERFKNKEADGLIVAHLDRISRNLIEAGFISKLIKQGILQEIITPFKTYTEDDAVFIEMELVMAADLSRKLSKRVKEGVESKLLKGQYPSYAPIGYINKNPKIYPDPKRSVYITEAYKLYASGTYSLQDLTDYLYRKGFRTRIQNKKVRTSVIHRILTDPIYYGAIRRNGNIYAGIHKALIDKATFDSVQDILNGKDKGKTVDHTFMYRGYLYCDICLCKLTAALKKKKHIYYYCTNGKGRCYQHKKYIKHADMKDILQEAFNPFSLDKELADLSFDLYAHDFKENHITEDKMKNAIEMQIKETDDKLSKLLDLLLADKITQQRYDEKSKELEDNKAQLKIELHSLKPVNVEFTLEQVEKIKNQACDLAEMFREGDDVVREDLLKSVLWNATIKDKKVIDIRYKLPWDFIKDLHKTRDLAKWRRRPFKSGHLLGGI